MIEKRKTPLIPVIVGATASGKSSLARELADHTGGRIICVDSRKIYRRLDIGTAKPSPEVIKKYGYGMVDLIEPDERYSAYQYAQTAVRVIEETIALNRQPILAGGTGLYLRALKDGFFAGPGADREIRAAIDQEATEVGWAAMYEKLCRIDPEAAAKIDAHNIPRIQRALEVYLLTGEKISRLQRDGKYRYPPWHFLLLGIDRPRRELHARIDRRTELMIEQGLFREVEALLATGIKPSAPGLMTVGYQEAIAHLSGKLTCAQTVEKIKTNTRQYAKRQLTWFRHQETVQWLDPATNMAEVVLDRLRITGS